MSRAEPEQKIPYQEPDHYTVEELLDVPEKNLEHLDNEKLANTSSAILAQFLDRLEVNERRDVLRQLPNEPVSEILSEMDSVRSAEVVGAMREERALEILEEFDPDDAADIVAELDEETRQRLMAKLEPETQATVEQLMTYDPETAGGIMTPEVATVRKRLTIDQAIGRIRKLNEELEDISYVYVVNEEDKLEGVISMRDLIIFKPQETVEKIMKPLQGVVATDTDREEVALILADLNLLSVPVVDSEGRLVGIVTVDDVIDILQDEATEDIQKLVGAGGDESIHDEFRYSLRMRHPWLQVNLLTAVAAAAITYAFRDKIEANAFLAVFMTIIASMGGNGGAQTLAVAIRSIAVGEVETRDARRVCMKEFGLGSINGLLTGVIAAIVGYLVTRELAWVWVILVANILNMGIAGLAGAFIPLMLKQMNLDPAQSSSIFLTTVTDMAGFLIFLSLGSIFLL